MIFLKKHLWKFIIAFIILGIGTCNYCMNTSNVKNMIDNPKPGDYYVFKDFPKGSDESIMKIKEVRVNEVEFFLPSNEIIGGFKIGTSESAVKKADETGQMFDNETIIVPKNEIKDMYENDNLSGAVKNKPRIEWVF